MNKCVTCRFSYAEVQYGDGESGEFSLRPVLMCNVTNERAVKPCNLWEPEPENPAEGDKLERE